MSPSPTLEEYNRWRSDSAALASAKNTAPSASSPTVLLVPSLSMVLSKAPKIKGGSAPTSAAMITISRNQMSCARYGRANRRTRLSASRSSFLPFTASGSRRKLIIVWRIMSQSWNERLPRHVPRRPLDMFPGGGADYRRPGADRPGSASRADRGGPPIRRTRGPARRVGSRACGRVPDRDRRRDAGHGALRRHDRREVRRSGARPADLLRRDRRARGRLDVPVGCPQHPRDGRQSPQGERDRGCLLYTSPSPREWRDPWVPLAL